VWADRVFMEGMRANGHNLYGALDPYEQWQVTTFSKQVPISTMLHSLATGGSLIDSAHEAMRNFASGGDAPILHPGQGYADLHTLADMNDRFSHGDNTSIDQGTQDFLGNMNADRTNSTALVMMLAAYSQKYGSMGQNAMVQRMLNISEQFNNQGSATGADGNKIMILNYLMSQVSD